MTSNVNIWDDVQKDEGKMEILVENGEKHNDNLFLSCLRM